MPFKLTKNQQTFLAQAGREAAMNNFYLSGGTALAAHYLGHRFSDDLDFFVFNEPDWIGIEAMIQRIKNNFDAAEVYYEKIHDRRIYIFEFADNEQLKTEFTLYPFKQLEPAQQIDGFGVDSLRDIAANKLMALIDRFDPKDFVDIYFLTQSASLSSIRADAEKKFAVNLAPLIVGSELMKVDRVAALPKMIKPLTIDILKEKIHSLAQGLREEVVE